MNVTREADKERTNYTRTRFYSAVVFCSLGILVYWMAAVAFSEEISTNDNVLAVLKRLSNGNASTRRSAVAELGRMNDSRAVPGLIRALQDASPYVRSQAADSLKFLRAKEASQELSRLLTRDPDARVRQAAAQALARIADPKTTPALIGCLKDAQDPVRHGCIKALGILRAKDAVAPLSRLLSDPNPHIAAQALSSLGSIGSPEAQEAVRRQLDSKVPLVEEAAVRALSEMGKPEMLAGLQAKLKSSSPRVQGGACLALAKLKDSSALPACLKLAASPEPSVRIDAARALALIGDASARQALASALQKEGNAAVRRAMMLAVDDLKARTGP